MSRSLTVGTSEKADVVIKDEYASAIHCRIVEDADGSYRVLDLGSTNGTWIHRGETRIRVWGPVRLHRGDKIRVGRTVLPWEAR